VHSTRSCYDATSTNKIDNTIILNYLAAGLSIHSLHKINVAITKTSWLKQAAATHLELGVATSATKITIAPICYYCAT
jgi:hypothetical protein